MGWERRTPSGAAYLYLSRRDAAGRVVKEYVGRGPRAEAAARDLARRQAHRDADRRAAHDAQARLAAADALTAELAEAAAVLTEAVLLAVGFHRPNYGPWRRRRDG